MICYGNHFPGYKSLLDWITYDEDKQYKIEYFMAAAIEEGREHTFHLRFTPAKEKAH